MVSGLPWIQGCTNGLANQCRGHSIIDKSDGGGTITSSRLEMGDPGLKEANKMKKRGLVMLLLPVAALRMPIWR